MSERFNNLDGKLITGRVVGISGASGLVGGAVAANNLFPPTIEYMPGLEAEVRLSTEEGAKIDSAFTSLDAPNMPVDTPFPAIDGIHAKITELSPPVQSKGHNEAYASLISEFQDIVVQPTTDILKEHLIRGGAIGFFSAVAISYLGLRAVRTKKRNEKDTTQSLDGVIAESAKLDNAKLNDSLANLKNQLSKNTLGERRKKIRNSIVATAIILATMGMGSDENDMPADSVSATNTVQLSPILTEREPGLEDATLTGSVGEVVNTLAYGATEYANTVDEFWQSGANEFEAAYSQYEQGDGKKYVGDPNIIPIVHVSDLHCNYANYEHYLKPVFQRLKSPIIVNTGDTFTNSNTMPYEKDCFTNFADAVRPGTTSNELKTTIVNIAGNHDSKEPIHYEDENLQVITLNKNNIKAEVDGINFVGMEDPAITIWYPTLPADPEELNERIAEQGYKTASEACKITEKTGAPPVVLSHRMKAAYETINEGCASLILNGDTHNNAPVKKFYGVNGNQVLQHTVGSASGAKIGVTIYESPKQDASLTIQYYDKVSAQFVGFATVILNTYGLVEIRHEEVPDNSEPLEEITEMNEFLMDYSDK